VDGRPLAEDRVEPRRIHGGDRRRVEPAQAALEVERAAEGLLDGDLLVEDEADQEGKGLVDEERSASSSPVK
jgi:hypothetical protein